LHRKKGRKGLGKGRKTEQEGVIARHVRKTRAGICRISFLLSNVLPVIVDTLRFPTYMHASYIATVAV
jgi:hypothetical protein